MNTSETTVKKPKLKIIITTAASVAFVLLFAFVILLFTAESRIPGIWHSDTNYLSAYSSDCQRSLKFDGDGSYESVLTDSEGNVVNSSRGYWTVAGFKAEVIEEGEPGTIIYRFNPLTGKLKNGIWTYSK